MQHFDQTVSAAIEALYDCALAPARWPRALDLVARCFNGEGTTLTTEVEKRAYSVVVSPGLETAAADYATNWAKQDFLANRIWEHGLSDPSGVTTDWLLATPEEINTEPYYTEFYAKHGLGWFLCMQMSPAANTNVVMSVQRAKTKGAFRREEFPLLVELGRHAERAMRLSVQLVEGEMTKFMLGEALARLKAGVVVLDEGLQVRFANAAFESLCGDGMDINVNRLSIGDPDGTAALKRQIKTVAAGVASSSSDLPPFLIPRRHGRLPLVGYLVPVSGGGREMLAEVFSTARFLLLVLDNEAGEAPDPALVRDLFGLTLGEARVAALISTGLRPKQVASRLDITEGTARVVLKRVFAKLDISSQPELAALLTRIALAK